MHSFQTHGLIFLSTVLLACSPKNNAESQSMQAVHTRTLPPGNCETCELIFVGMPEEINAVDTSQGWDNEGQKLMVSGKIYELDQKTPASNIVLYYYHTDRYGIYSPGPGMPDAARRHGHLRGWVKTGTEGAYTIYTNRPANYPNGEFEAHIHVIIKEPDMNLPYWIDAWVFDDDPKLTPELRKRMENRGGSGIMMPHLENGVQIAHQDIILGLNVPDYPVKK